MNLMQNFKKIIDKSQNLMYNKYVRLRKKNSMLADGVAVVTWLLHAMIVASVPLNTRKLSALGNVPRLRRCGGMAYTADSKSAA